MLASAPSTDLLNSQFFLPTVTGRMEFSLGLLERLHLPSSRNVNMAFRLFLIYVIALESLPLPVTGCESAHAKKASITGFSYYWSKEDDKELKKKYDEGYGISEIAIEVGRTENSISKRIKDLKLDAKRYNTKRREPKQKGCICGKCNRYQRHECNGPAVDGTCCTDKQE